MLTLLRAGLYTSVQDAGRFGLRQSGVSYCGALDRPSLEIANLLVGNPGSTAALEITLGQCVIEFGQETWFALTGAGCDATLDGKAVWTGWRLRAKAGQRLTLKRPLHGVRSYLAVAGGIDLLLTGEHAHLAFVSTKSPKIDQGADSDIHCLV